MRIRSIRPEFWTSEDVACHDWDVRLIFIGLWSYVDDNGVGRDVDKLITADLFPLEDDPRETVARVSRALARLSEGNLITRYTVDSKPYLHINTWTTHQRIDKAAKARYPLPTCENAIPRESVARVSRDRREGSPIGEGEKGRRGEGEKGIQTPAPTTLDAVAFDAFWAAYPKRKDKGHARTAWVKAVRKADAETITAAAARFAADPNLPEPQFIPMPSTWLNGERWEDGPCQPRTTGSSDRQGEILRREMAKALEAEAQQPRQIGAAS